MANYWENSKGKQLLKDRIKLFPTTSSSIEIFESITPEEWAVLRSEGRGLGLTKRWSVYRQICKMRQNGAA